MSDSGNNSLSSSDQSGESPGATRYGGYARGYSSRGYHRGGGSGGRYASYSNGDSSYPPHQYRSGDPYYSSGSRYYAGRGNNGTGAGAGPGSGSGPGPGGAGAGTGTAGGYYHSRGGGNYGGHRYNQAYSQDYNSYYRGGNNGTLGRRNQENEGRRYSANPNSRYHGGRRSEPWGSTTESMPPQGLPTYGSGNNTPVDSYHRNHSTSSKGEATPSSHSMNSSAYIPAPAKRRVNKNDSPFLYLTDLDKSTDDPKELDEIREVLKESDRLDKALEEQNFLLLKNELELGILATQSEKDTLSVRLTQEKLDTFLMES